MDDPSSVDLLATLSNTETIFEVKTVTIKSLPHRMRLGVGQLLEYRYRRQVELDNRPTALLVISSTVTLPQWMINFFEQELSVGLLGFGESENFVAYTTGAIEQSIANITN